MSPGSPIYLDHNATAPVPLAVIEAVANAMAMTGNPSSVHTAGRRARAAVEDARDQVALLCAAAPAGVIFTAGATEANNLALRGAGCARVLVSAIEHDSVLAARDDAQIIPVTADGRVDIAALESMLARDAAPTLVSVMFANNETGVVQPVAEVAAIAHAHGALVHTDAVQAAGRLPIDMAALGVDMLSLSAHKIGGPQGVGALLLAGDVPLAPLIRGGGQERRRRAGTENAAAIAGFGLAAELARGDLGAVPAIAELRDILEQRIRAVAPAAVVHGAAARRLCNTSCFGMPDHAAETLIIALDLAGIAVSAGAACSSGKVAQSHVLTAMGVAPAAASEAIRVSLGPDTTAAHIDALVVAWTQHCGLAQRSAA